jgi:TRAP-type C4-dicarboxylate transport system permease small subunit
MTLAHTARRCLDGLYLGSGLLAACFLLLILLTITGQIIGRFIGIAIDSTEIGGFSLAATTFLGLGYTLRHGGHVRVTLLIRYAGGRLGRAVELWCSGVAAVSAVYFAGQVVNMVHDSWRFGDLSPGLLAIPIWIPQTGMAVGLVVLAVAFADDFVHVLRGHKPVYEAAAEGVLETKD